jgi:transcriptional regulator with XRE-family HTH domain
VSIGEGLARARHEAGLSLAQISQRTRIREKIIADIENDDYSACGGDFYARGHIRSIARAIGTDPGPFIREYDAAQQEPDEFAETEITQPGIAIGTPPGIPLRTDPGPPPRSQPGAPLGTERGWPAPAEPGWGGAAEPGPPAPAEPGWGSPAEPGWGGAAEPGPPAPAEPGWGSPAEPGWGAAAEPGWGSPAEPGWGAAAEPGPPAPAEPGWGAAAEPGWGGVAEPGPPAAAEPGWSSAAEPGPPAPAEPGWGAAAEPGWSSAAEPGPPAPAEPGRTARTDPGRPARTDPGFPFLAEPDEPAGARLASPGDPRLPPPPGQSGRHSLPPAPVPPGRTHRRRALNWAALLALVLLAGLGYLVYHLVSGSSQVTSSAHSAPARPPASHSAVPSSPAPTPTPSPSPKPTPRARPLAPVGAQALGVGGPGDNTANAHLAIDGNPGTGWHTDWYTTAAFGNLYAGTGLLVDMGRPVRITAARIQFGPAHGGSFQLRVGSHASLAGLRPVAHGVAAGVAQLRLASPARGRYVLIWFTSLPVDPTGNWRASVYDVRLRGR